jgi:hypothetical protein
LKEGESSNVKSFWASVNRRTSGGRGGSTSPPPPSSPVSGPVTLPVSDPCPPNTLTLYSTGLLDTDDLKNLYKKYTSEETIYARLRSGSSISSSRVQIYINRYNDAGGSEQWKHKDNLSEQELNDKVRKYKLLKNRFESYANCMLYRIRPVTIYINKLDSVIKMFEPTPNS